MNINTNTQNIAKELVNAYIKTLNGSAIWNNQYNHYLETIINNRFSVFKSESNGEYLTVETFNERNNSQAVSIAYWVNLYHELFTKEDRVDKWLKHLERVIVINKQIYYIGNHNQLRRISNKDLLNDFIDMHLVKAEDSDYAPQNYQQEN